MAADTKANHN